MTAKVVEIIRYGPGRCQVRVNEMTIDGVSDVSYRESVSDFARVSIDIIADKVIVRSSDE